MARRHISSSPGTAQGGGCSPHHNLPTSRTALFWAAFVVTRPLGAVVGDFLDKPVANGGLALSRYSASGVLVVAIAAIVLLAPHRAAERTH